jgi:hypothetical protein
VRFVVVTEIEHVRVTSQQRRVAVIAARAGGHHDDPVTSSTSDAARTFIPLARAGEAVCSLGCIRRKET